MYDKREYQRQYQLKRYYKRREQAFKILGELCIKCGNPATDIDHIDPKSKSVDLSKLWGVSEKRWLTELQKCQSLCRECHLSKTQTEQTTRTHGTHAMYRRGNCRCNLCVNANKEYMRQWNKT